MTRRATGTLRVRFLGPTGPGSQDRSRLIRSTPRDGPGINTTALEESRGYEKLGPERWSSITPSDGNNLPAVLLLLEQKKLEHPVTEPTQMAGRN
jgi:hypothetical protein